MGNWRTADRATVAEFDAAFALAAATGGGADAKSDKLDADLCDYLLELGMTPFDLYWRLMHEFHSIWRPGVKQRSWLKGTLKQRSPVLKRAAERCRRFERACPWARPYLSATLMWYLDAHGTTNAQALQLLRECHLSEQLEAAADAPGEKPPGAAAPFGAKERAMRRCTEAMLRLAATSPGARSSRGWGSTLCAMQIAADLAADDLGQSRINMDAGVTGHAIDLGLVAWDMYLLMRDATGMWRAKNPVAWLQAKLRWLAKDAALRSVAERFATRFPTVAGADDLAWLLSYHLKLALLEDGGDDDASAVAFLRRVAAQSCDRPLGPQQLAYELYVTLDGNDDEAPLEDGGTLAAQHATEDDADAASLSLAQLPGQLRDLLLRLADAGDDGTQYDAERLGLLTRLERHAAEAGICAVTDALEGFCRDVVAEVMQVAETAAAPPLGSFLWHELLHRRLATYKMLAFRICQDLSTWAVQAMSSSR